MRKRTTLIFAAAMVFAGVGEACENLQFQSLPRVVSVESPSALSFNVRANTTAAGCDFFVTFGNGGSLTATNRRLTNGTVFWPFNIYKNVSRFEILRDVGDFSRASERLSGSFAKADGVSQKTFTVHLRADSANPYRPVGNYEDDIVVSIYRGIPDSRSLVTSAVVKFSARAQERTDLSVAADAPSDVLVASNAPYLLKLNGKTVKGGATPAGGLRFEVETAKDPVTVTIESRE